ncbi:MAG: hypothetical protein GY711_19505 [bacterium]|nr:hypothetical protein [bacterium]
MRNNSYEIMKNHTCSLPLLVAGLAAPAVSQSFEDAPWPPSNPTSPEHEIEAPSFSRNNFDAPLSIRELMTKPLVDVAADGDIWVRTRDFRASLDESGLTVYPVFGKQSPQEWPVRFEVVEATRGNTTLGTAVVGQPVETDTTVELERTGLREVYNVGLDSVEQTFVFDELPGSGDLVVRMAVETELRPVLGESTFNSAGLENGAGASEMLRFVHDTFGEVTYGQAFVVDAAGARQSIERTWTGSAIELRVPESFLANAVLPVTIDPPLDAFSQTFGVADDSRPDIVFCGQSDEYLACWEEYTSAANADVYVTKWNSTGTTQGDSFAIEMSNANWTSPRLAYVYGPDRALVVASVNPDGPSSEIRGRIVDMSIFDLAGADFQISTFGVPKRNPDVGGTGRDNLLNTHFCVIWSSLIGGTHGNVQYQVVDWDGSFVGTRVTVDSSAANDITPTISNGVGDPSSNSHYWTVAWIRDSNDDGRGQVYARRIVWSGGAASGEGNFQVESSALCANPSVTSQFDADLGNTNERPSIVAYDRRFASGSHPSGFQRSIYARVIIDGEVFGRSLISATLEDFDPELDQWGPSIATDGRGFFLTYAEESWFGIGTENFDMYMVSGNISDEVFDGRIALAERHRLLADSSDAELHGRVCTRWDGEASTFSDDGAVLFTTDTGTAGDARGRLNGSTLDHPTYDAGLDRAVGVQYCDANPNSVGSGGGRNSSWLWIEGTQSAGDSHTAYCVEMPQNQFGYLNTSLTIGNLNMPGGSVGRLCIGGNIGRYVTEIEFSGVDGEISTQIFPGNLPQGTGPVAAQPGETWHFQVWHRDMVGGIQTSNFSNACSVTFLP